MVEREIRSAVAMAINKYLDGHIGSQSLDDALWECRLSTDATSNAICSEMWFLYSDSEDHRNIGKWRLAAQHETMLRRWIRVLCSDWEMAEPRTAPLLTRIARVFFGQSPTFHSNLFWPFENEAEWDRWVRQGCQNHFQL